MKVAYVTKDDPSDIHAWSGLVTYILKSLQRSGLDVIPIGDLNNKDFIAFFKGAIYGRVIQKTYLRDNEPSLLKSYAAQVKKALDSTRHDIVFSSRIVPIAHLQTEKPIVFWHDATFAGLYGLYPGTQNLCAETIRNGNKTEQLALSKCQLAIYSSEWAARTAIQNYIVDPAKVKVVPFGANIESHRNVEDVQAILEKKNFDICRLLFIGSEWFRKGGDIAVEVASLLNSRGIPTELHIIGGDPKVTLPAFAIKHGFISKATPEGRQHLDNLFLRANFFILPTRADCTPVVFPEACSFGLPILTTNVGGIPTIITNGKNGQMFALEESPSSYCDYIERLWSNKEEYNQLALSSFREYSERLNWVTSGRKVRELIQEFCS
jgi:glycosyltransferase involved in cell wall biosynthesis